MVDVYSNGNCNGYCNGNGHTEKQGGMKIYLPDGDLEAGKRDPVPIGRLIWQETGLPYADSNVNAFKYKIEKEGKYVVRIEKDSLSSLGYPVDNLEYVLIGYARPHDIPQKLEKQGFGITGKDLMCDKLQIPVVNGLSNDLVFFIKELKEKGIKLINDLAYKPTALVFAFDKQLNLETYDDIERYCNDPNKPLTIASEFSYLPATALKKLSHLMSDNYELIITTGKTEGSASIGDTDGIFDVVETGNSLISSDRLAPVKPPAFMYSTPHIFVNRATDEKYSIFINELQCRLMKAKENIMNQYPEYFHSRLSPQILE